MLPPDFAAFSFHLDPAATDDALAERTLAAAGPGRIALMGAGRFGLALALARRGAHAVVYDPSRIALALARDAARAAGLMDRLTLFAADPRDVGIPGGADGALVPAFAWRALLFREAQAQALQCLARALRRGGAVCLEVDRLPAEPPAGERAEIRSGPGGQAWWWRREADPAVVTLGCDAPRAGTIDVAISAISPEETAALLAEQGFSVAEAPSPAAPRLLLVGRT